LLRAAGTAARVAEDLGELAETLKCDGPTMSSIDAKCL